MGEFGDYLKQVRQAKGMTINQLAMYSKISSAQLSRIENGKRGVPKPATIKKLSDALKVPYELLMGKAGYIIKDAHPSYDFDQIHQLVRIPLLGQITADKPILAEEHIARWETLPIPNRYQQGEIFAIYIKGDHMTGSRIYPGDLAIVRIQPQVENGEIAVVNVNGENATLKRVKQINEHLILYADNPKYEPNIIERNRVRICGKVIHVIFNPNETK
jgi:repressor LexA